MIALPPFDDARFVEPTVKHREVGVDEPTDRGRRRLCALEPDVSVAIEQLDRSQTGTDEGDFLR